MCMVAVAETARPPTLSVTRLSVFVIPLIKSRAHPSGLGGPVSFPWYSAQSTTVGMESVTLKPSPLPLVNGIDTDVSALTHPEQH